MFISEKKLRRLIEEEVERELEKNPAQKKAPEFELGTSFGKNIGEKKPVGMDVPKLTIDKKLKVSAHQSLKHLRGRPEAWNVYKKLMKLAKESKGAQNFINIVTRLYNDKQVSLNDLAAMARLGKLPVDVLGGMFDDLNIPDTKFMSISGAKVVSHAITGAALRFKF